jgi:hypothetical protein
MCWRERMRRTRRARHACPRREKQVVSLGSLGRSNKLIAGILFHRTKGVLAVFLRLIFHQQRHDLTHHHAHKIIAQVLCGRDELHPVLGQLADIELELVAEASREAVNDNDVDLPPSARIGSRPCSARALEARVPGCFR